MQLFHGSAVVVAKPDLAHGKPTNDYGRGFYCTADRSLACEWACPSYSQSGHCNEYDFDTGGLEIFNLDTAAHGALSWIATLIAHRKVNTGHTNRAEIDAFVARYACELSTCDVVEGYRADDSYFQIVRSFVSNGIALEQLDSCLRLGNLGRQIVLRSQAAIDALAFAGSTPADARLYYPLRARRNAYAAAELNRLRAARSLKDGTYFIDIIREL